jgi:Protein of unknown function (DUF1552)
MRSISRRRLLQGLGVSLALPVGLGQSFSVSRAAARAPQPQRMAFLSIPNGVQQDRWFPKVESNQMIFNQTMQPLDPVKSSINVIGGLNHEHATAGNDGAGDHARSSATFLTGARARKTAGRDIYVGVSVDQVAAKSIGQQTRLPSLELSCDAIRNSGSCDSGYACAYQYNLAWSTPTTPVTPEPNPRMVFERLFGSGPHGERQRNYALRQATDRSVLDFVLDEAHDMGRALGSEDRRKLDEYFSSVRQIEQNLKAAENRGQPIDPEQATPSGIPTEFRDHIDLMLELLCLAFQTDSTRIATALLAYDGSNRTFPELGVIEGHHYLTHNQRVSDLAEKVGIIDRFYVERLAKFLIRLDELKDLDGNSILHNSMVVYGGAIADGNKHTHDNLPVIMAGKAGGQISSGRFVQVDPQPMSNLFVEMLQCYGVAAESFGDSTGRLAAIRS